MARYFEPSVNPSPVSQASWKALDQRQIGMRRDPRKREHWRQIGRGVAPYGTMGAVIKNQGLTEVHVMTTGSENSGQQGAAKELDLPAQPRLPRSKSVRDHAAQLLMAPAALMQLNLVEAKIVVSYMKPERVKAGQTFIQEGDAENVGFMVLVLEGDVLVESITVNRTEPVTITVLGPGSLVGEMGLLDTGPRSASCTANTDLLCAVLTRDALESLINQQPALGAKLLLAISARIAERYRDTARKLKLFARLAATMQQELDHKG